MRFSGKYIKYLIPCLLIGIGLAFFSACSKPFYKPSYTPSINIDPSNIEIARDKWGVPHIFAPTDAEVAYGLAWANAETAFDWMQEQLLATAGHMGHIIGKDGAAIDFYVHLIDAQGLVEREFHKLSPDYVRYLEGYCAGVNAYAKAHPKKVMDKRILPVTPKDIVQAYVVGFSALSGVPTEVERIVTGKVSSLMQSLGSNAFAFRSPITADDHTYLCINPHFRVEGPLSFHEIHLNSEEGLNVAGCAFQGGTSVFLGTNDALGWAHTFNHFDRVDSYKLKTHPDDELLYEFDGKWHKLEVRPVKLRVKLAKWLPIVIPVKRKTYWSKYGPALKGHDGEMYAIRAAAIMTVGAGEQFYRMNKSKNFEEFKEALEMQRVAMFNLVYADKDANIYYLHNGLFPHRNDKHEWYESVDGTTSKTLWNDFYTIDELPQVLNPDCGYVFNTNNTPFNASCGEANEKASKFPKYMDKRPGDNNRAERFMELLKEKEAFNFEDFKSIKFDYQYPEKSRFWESIGLLFKLDEKKYPDIAELLQKIKKWDKKGNPNNPAASIVLVSTVYIFQKEGYSDAQFSSGMDADEALWIESLRHTKQFLLQHYGTVDVSLTDIQRFYRGDYSYGVLSLGDMLMANYSFPNKKKEGEYELVYGDSYAQFVSFSKNGIVKMESVLPFNAKLDTLNYKDQLPLYNKLQTKTISLDKANILKNAKKVYHPIK